ncbi:MAG: hypothetical protein QM764_02030 [Chitinophagaceae bacterium]
MEQSKLNSGDLVVLKTNQLIIYKLIRLTKSGLNAVCMNFKGEQKIFPTFNLKKLNLA